MEAERRDIKKRHKKFSSLNPNNWKRKIGRRPIMLYVLRNLIKNEFINRLGHSYIYNKKKSLSPTKLSKRCKEVADSLSMLRASNGFTANLPVMFPIAITLREMVPTEIIKKSNVGVQYEVWKEILNNVPICAVPSTDIHASFGMSQMTRETYISLRRLFSRFIKEKYHECIDYECQIRTTFLLTYSNLNNAWNFLMKEETRNNFNRIWENSSDKERKEFVVYIASLMLNAGFNSDMRGILKYTFGDMGRKIRKLSSALKIMQEYSDKVKPHNDSGTYAKNVLDFYNYLETIPFYNQYSRNAFKSSPKIIRESSRGNLNIEKVLKLKKVERKSKKTGNKYGCYVFTINGKNREWNKKMIKGLLKNPTKANIQKIIQFNGKKEARGVIAIPEQFFNEKEIGDEFIVIENKWKSYKDVVLSITKVKNKEELERKRAILYALNNSKEARNLKKIRIPKRFLR